MKLSSRIHRSGRKGELHLFCLHIYSVSEHTSLASVAGFIVSTHGYGTGKRLEPQGMARGVRSLVSDLVWLPTPPQLLLVHCLRSLHLSPSLSVPTFQPTGRISPNVPQALPNLRLLLFVQTVLCIAPFPSLVPLDDWALLLFSPIPGLPPPQSPLQLPQWR